MKALLASCLLLASTSVPALAQKEIPKAEGHDQCPLGYVNTLGTTCVSPIYYEVAPTNGKACLSGWVNIGARNHKTPTFFQVADVDIGVIHWVNAEFVTHIVQGSEAPCR